MLVKEQKQEADEPDQNGLIVHEAIIKARLEQIQNEVEKLVNAQLAKIQSERAIKLFVEREQEEMDIVTIMMVMLNG